MGTFWFSLAAWQAVVWAMALALLWLDRQPPAAMAPWRKLHVPFSNVREPTFREMLPVVLRNQARCPLPDRDCTLAALSGPGAYIANSVLACPRIT